MSDVTCFKLCFGQMVDLKTEVDQLRHLMSASASCTDHTVPQSHAADDADGLLRCLSSFVYSGIIVYDLVVTFHVAALQSLVK